MCPATRRINRSRRLLRRCGWAVGSVDLRPLWEVAMKRLSGTDALFLSTETPAWHQHVGGLTVVDPAESERFSFDEVRRTLLERIPRVPKFRWKLKEVPLHLDRAVWVEDKDFNIDKH